MGFYSNSRALYLNCVVTIIMTAVLSILFKVLRFSRFGEGILMSDIALQVMNCYRQEAENGPCAYAHKRIYNIARKIPRFIRSFVS